MISRHIACEPKNDDYGRLARYIADAGHKGEKCLMSWCSGCWSGDDEYQLAIKEVEDTQALNTRTGKEKTYHLIISFRPEDEARLTPEVFREIEQEFARALGFEEHQRHAGVHKNTDNLHLHIAFNTIHPEKRTRHDPYWDFAKRDQLCRRLERKYGLTPDNGRDPGKETVTNEAAQAFEVYTGQESFLSYAQGHKSDIVSALAQAPDWPACHQVFLKFGLCLKPHGNGMIIQSHDGKHSIKASGFDRSVSKAQLEKRFGQFQPLDAAVRQSNKPAHIYQARPVQKEPDRNDLYQRFQTGRQKRQAELAAVNQQEKRLVEIYTQRWEQVYQNIMRTPMLKTHRREALKSCRDRKRKELDSLRGTFNQKRDEVKKRFPYSNWTQYLRIEAMGGNETALAVLRSKKDKAWPERTQPPGMSSSQLSVVSKMAEVFRIEGVKNGHYHIDRKGTVIFTLPTGGSIRDNGRAIHFSVRDDMAKSLAEKLAQSKWGQNVHLEGGVLKSKDFAYTPIQRSPVNGLGR